MQRAGCKVEKKCIQAFLTFYKIYRFASTNHFPTRPV